MTDPIDKAAKLIDPAAFVSLTPSGAEAKSARREAARAKVREVVAVVAGDLKACAAATVEAARAQEAGDLAVRDPTLREGSALAQALFETMDAGADSVAKAAGAGAFAGALIATHAANRMTEEGQAFFGMLERARSRCAQG